MCANFSAFIIAPDLSNQQAADLSTLYDIGGIFGGIMAGLLSDQTGMSALTCGGYFILTIPMVLYITFFLEKLSLGIFWPPTELDPSVGDLKRKNVTLNI